MKTCPSPADLRRLAAGQLAETEYQEIESHLETCSSCQQILTRLSDEDADPLWRLLADTAPVSVPEFLHDVARNPHSAETKPDSNTSNIHFPDPSADAVGLGRLGPYQIVRELGGGTFGVVYLAYDDLDRPVALKVLRPERATSSQDRARFEREARAAAAVKHDHVITVHYVGQTPGFPLPYLVMEYVEGESLADLLKRHGVLEPSEAARITREVALGLAAAHERGLVHRDIKPSNILLDGTTGRSRIADFGLARAVEAAGACGTFTGQVMGTPAYMSPEQVIDPTRIDGRSDLYSLGVVLYELLTGERPFRGVPEMVMHQAVHEEPRPPRALNAQIPRDLEVITMKCLAKEPGRRYQTAAELAADLGRWRNGEPIHARPAGRVERLIRWGRRNRALAASLILAAAALLAVTVVSICFAWVQSESRERLSAANNRLEEDKQNLVDLSERRRRALRLAALLAQERSLSACAEEDVSRGLLLLTESLHIATQSEDAAVQKAIRGQLSCWYQRPEASPWGHQAGLTAVVLSPDGKTVLTGDESGRARLWDTATGQPLGPVMKHPAAVTAVAFHPRDPHLVLTGTGFPEGDEDRFPQPGKDAVRFWDPMTGKSLVDPPLACDGPIAAIAFRPDGQRFLTASNVPHKGDDAFDQRGVVQVWTTDNRQQEGGALRVDYPLRAAVFSPDGKRILAGGGNDDFGEDRPGRASREQGHARLWDLDHPTAPPRKFSQRYPIRCVAFRSDGQAIVTGGGMPARAWDADDEPAAGEARLWRLNSSGPSAPIRLPHQWLVRAVAFSPDGKRVVTGGGSGGDLHPLSRTMTPMHGEAHRWDAASGKSLGAALVQGDTIRAVAFSADGKTAWVRGSASRARSWDVATGQEGEQPLEHHGPLLAIAVSPDGRLVLTGSADGTARLWDAETALPVGRPLRHKDRVDAVGFSPDSRTALTGSADGTACLWDITTGERRHTLEGHRGAVLAVAFSSDGRTVATSGADGTARLWRSDTGEAVGDPIRHDGPVLAVAFRPDGKVLVTGSEGKDKSGVAGFWDVPTGAAAGSPLPHLGPVRALAFSAAGDLLLTGSGARSEEDEDKPARHPGAARLWNATPPYEFVCSLFEPFFPRGPVPLMDPGMHPRRRPAALPQQRQGEDLEAAAFSADGRLTATGSSEGRVQLWEMDTRRPLGPPIHAGGAVRALAFRPNSRTVFAATEGASPLVWSVPPALDGDLERIRVWVEVVTGMRLDANGVARRLEADDLTAQRARLDELGGAPIAPPDERP